jgi:hypothetical protein
MNNANQLDDSVVVGKKLQVGWELELELELQLMAGQSGGL